jgi:oligopeptide transport system substrate-binding protein
MDAPGEPRLQRPLQGRDWRPDEVLQCERNPYYWDAANVKPDGVYFYPISNEQQEERRFRTGEFDMTYTVPMHAIEEYKAEHPNELVLAPYLQTYYYRFNCTKPPFNDPRVRQAFSMALDREEIAKQRHEGGRAPGLRLRAARHGGLHDAPTR